MPDQERNKTGRQELELSFSTTKLRDICEKRGAAVLAVGKAVALELERCLADVEASENAADLAALFPDDVLDRSPDKRSLRLTTGHELVFRSGHVVTPITTTGATDWTKVTRMRIIALEANDA